MPASIRAVHVFAAASLAMVLALPASSSSGAGTPACLGRPATLVRTGGDVHLRGTDKADVIVTGSGEDVIDGGGGNDRICSAGGADRIVGGVGRDQVDAGPGNDSSEGSNGSDRIDGGPGTDTLIGNRGNDQLLGGPGGRDFGEGGLGDDTVSGGPGDSDQLIGELGNDKLHGGSGDGDSLRGDGGGDLFDGGPGAHDVASFATAGLNGEVNGGVSIDLSSGRGGSHGRDRVLRVEDVIGSPYNDNIAGSSAPNDLYGAGGRDALSADGPGDAAFGGSEGANCRPYPESDAFATEESCESESEPEPELPPRPIPSRLALELPGGPSSSTLTAVARRGSAFSADSPILRQGFEATVAFETGAWIVRAQQIELSVGEGCTAISAAEARCPVQAKPDAVFVAGSRADDRIEIDPGMPTYVSALIRGEEGTDVLIGGAGDDTLEGSTFQTALTDIVIGRGGDDAIVNGRSMKGGPGSDLLIARVCAGEQVDGGPGIDSVSFARELAEGREVLLKATLGGGTDLVNVPSPGVQVPVCRGPDVPRTQIDASVERIEGSSHDDVLIGNGAANTLLGRGGDDRLIGRGGDDILVGGSDRDSFFGGEGRDRLFGQDGARDEAFDCGPGRGIPGVAKLDRGDPPPRRCLVRG